MTVDDLIRALSRNALTGLSPNTRWIVLSITEQYRRYGSVTARQKATLQNVLDMQEQGVRDAFSDDYFHQAAARRRNPA